MKQYKFDYLKERVNKWYDKTHVTRQQLYALPFYLHSPWIMPDEFIPMKDFYGEVIEDFDEWSKQREEYLDNLWVELGSYKENIW